MRQDLPHDPDRPLQAFPHAIEPAARRGGVPARQILARQGEIVRHPLHRIVDLVRHAGRQPPHRGEALGVEEPPLQLAHASLLARARLQAPAPPALLERQAA